MANRKSESEKVFRVVSRENKPFVVLPLASYESLMATMEELSDPGALKALRESQADVRAGRIVSFEEVFGEPLDAHRRTDQTRRQRARKS